MPEAPIKIVEKVVAEKKTFALCRKGAPLTTPAGAQLCVPSAPLAEALAATSPQAASPQAVYWKLSYTALDIIAPDLPTHQNHFATAGELLCHRVREPAALAAEQAKHWDAPLAWARRALDLELPLVYELGARPPNDTERLRNLAGSEPFWLAGILALAKTLGSAVLALAAERDAFARTTLWAAAGADEQWQRAQWGRLAEHEQQDAARVADAEIFADYLRLLG